MCTHLLFRTCCRSPADIEPLLRARQQATGRCLDRHGHGFHPGVCGLEMLLCPNLYSSLFLCAAATVFCTRLVPQVCMPWLRQEGLTWNPLAGLQGFRSGDFSPMDQGNQRRAGLGELGCLGLLFRKLLVIKHP